MTSEMRLQPTVAEVAGSVGYGVPVARESVSEKAVVKEPAREKAKTEDLTYGEIVYWLTLVGSAVVLLGSLLSFVTQSNFASPSYWISKVWEGSSTEEIWEGVGGTPNGHWYLSHLATGDGLQALGISVAVISIVIGLIISAIILFKRKSRLFGGFALISALIIVISVLGLLPIME